MPLFWLSLAFLTGILLAANLSIPILGWIPPVLIALVLLLPPVYRYWSRWIPPVLSTINRRLYLPGAWLYPLILLCMCLGAVRYQSAQPVISPGFIAYYNNQPGDIIVEGLLVEPPDVRDTYTNLRLKILQLRPGGESTFMPVKGLLLARVSPGTSFRYGDRIRLQGQIETPPETEGFSYREYLANHSIYSYMSFARADLLENGQANPLLSILYGLREKTENVTYRIFPDPEASLISGIILGVQTGISEELQEAFRITGTSHIVVISGFNITIVAAFFALVFSRLLGSFRGAIVSAIGIIFYTLLVGANPAVVRAAILGLLTLLAFQVGHRQVGMNSLVFAAALMALFVPTIIWDVSFQLSFAATLGIMLYAEPFNLGFTKFASRFMPGEKASRLAQPVGAFLLLTLAAQVTTLPLLVYYFKRLSLTALIANPLILPAQPLLMVLGGLAVIGGLFFLPLGQLLAWLAWPFAAYTIRMVELISTIPHGSIAIGQVALPLIFIFYLVLFIFTYFHSRLPSLAFRLSPAIPLVGMLAVTVLVWRAAYASPDGLLHVTIMDVGTGEAVLVQTPTGRNLLINGGPSTIRLSDALGRRLPPFYRSLDWLVVSGIDNEDLSGVPGNIERFPPSNVLWSGNSYGSRSASWLWEDLLSMSIPNTHMQSGQVLDLGSGAALEVLSENARGAVLLLRWENFRMLLPDGLNFEELETFQRDLTMRNISAVLVAESGYAPLNPPGFIDHLHPQLALLSVAPADRDGLPSPETLQALEGYNLLRTDENGWIEITTDGEQMWVEVEKKYNFLLFTGDRLKRVDRIESDSRRGLLP